MTTLHGITWLSYLYSVTLRHLKKNIESVSLYRHFLFFKKKLFTNNCILYEYKNSIMLTGRNQMRVEKNRKICEVKLQQRMLLLLLLLSAPPPASSPPPHSQRQRAGAAPSVNGLGLRHVTQHHSQIVNTTLPGKWVAGFSRTQRTRRQQEDY